MGRVNILWLLLVLVAGYTYTYAATDCTGLTGAYLTNCKLAPYNYTVVHSPTGPIGGISLYSVPAGREFWSFKGIPFAKPPTGVLRMRNPVKAALWTITRWSIEHGDICIQMVRPPKYEGSEDCLYLNVYVPKTAKNITELYPVIVIIPSAAFYTGNSNSDQYGPDRYMAEDVVVVSLNYRMGPYGFLNSGDQNIPGNAGLMDQVMALLWVRNNIRSFGGEPGLVTLTGDGSSICYHCAAEYTAGLFSGVILQSTSCLSAWAFQPNPRQIMIDMASGMNLSYTGIPDLAEQLRNAPVLDLLTVSAIIRLKAQNPIKHRTPYPLTPGIDAFMPSLIPAPPRDFMDILLTTGDKKVCHGVKIITGSTIFEGGFGKSDLVDNPTLLQDIEKDRELIVPSVCGVLPKGSNTSLALANKIWNYHFSGGLTEWSYYRYKTIMSSLNGNIAFARYNFKNGFFPYVYMFKLCSDTNYGRRTFFPDETCGDKTGPILTDDTSLIYYQTDIMAFFKVYSKNVTIIYHNDRTDADRRVSAQMIRFYVNFARKGNPNGCGPLDPLLGVEWKPVTNFKDIQVMNFDATLAMGQHPYQDDINFWETLCNV